MTLRCQRSQSLVARVGVVWLGCRYHLTGWRDQLNKAKVKPGIDGKPGKVLAEITFGFWIDLIKSANHWTLWVNPHHKAGQGRSLHKAFPNARVARSVIHGRLKAIQLLRNRISHHEPVLTSSNGLYNGVPTLITLPQLVECMEWVASILPNACERDFVMARPSAF